MMPRLCTKPVSELAASLTLAASQQTYYTVFFLVDKQRKPCAYQAYAYFRWLDDQIDNQLLEQSERQEFVSRQKYLMQKMYQGERPSVIAPEEALLDELINCDTSHKSGLQIYIRNMMEVMVFDASRRGKTISHRELSNYTRLLASGVTEALHHFIGHGSPRPNDKNRYHCAAAAHITHMLRDSIEDVRSGYFNIPGSYLRNHSLDPFDINSTGYCNWVRSRVELARRYFQAGRQHLSQVPNLRCRIAGFAYTLYFEQVLSEIEGDSFRLRPDYNRLSNAREKVILNARALLQAFFYPKRDQGFQRRIS